MCTVRFYFIEIRCKMPVCHNLKLEEDKNLEIHGDILLTAHVHNGGRSPLDVLSASTFRLWQTGILQRISIR